MAEYFVKDQVNWDAEILCVGEAPGKEEMAYGLPFMGQSGNKLKEWWRHAGIKREELYITNVLRVIPNGPGGNITAACARDRGLVDQIQDREVPRLAKVADSIPCLKVIVCVGNYAARAFTRYGSVQWDTKAAGISSVRGSIYPYKGAGGHTVYVIPTIHPAAVMRQPGWERRCIADWAKAARVAAEGPRRPDRRHIIFPDLSDVERWWAQVELDDVVSFDIETWGDGIKCVGFAVNERESITIPTELWAWEKIEGKTSRARKSLEVAWQHIRNILEGPNEKVGQNALFDCWWLAQSPYNIRVKGYEWDTLCMHHALIPNESHSLEFLASVYTDEPYWKDEAKDADAIVKVARQGMERLYVYNGLDVTVTWEVFSVLHRQLAARKMLGFYFRHYADMFQSLLRLMTTGAPVDRGMAEELRATYMEKAVQLRDEAGLIAKKPLFKFGGSALEKAMIADYYDNGPGIPLGESPAVWLDQFRQMTKTLKSGKVKRLWTDDQIDRKWKELREKCISDDLLNKVLYKEWKCPTGKWTDTGKEKADNVALKVLRNTVEARRRGDFMERQDDVVRLVDVTLEHRRYRKLATFANVGRLDDDDRMRCTYKFTTKTGRLASAANPKGTGTNLQNQDRAIRPIFVASPGRVLLECDLSQAESRVVKCLSGDKNAIVSARQLPTEGDEHTENAIDIFSHLYQKALDAGDITKDLRQIGKKVAHGANYDMGKFRLAEVLLKDGFTMTPYECGKLIQAHREKHPYIDIYQSNVRRTIIRERTLYTNWGRYVSFEDLRLDDGLYKFGYSWIPQSTIGDLLNQYGLKPLYHYIMRNGLKSDIILQVHDSVVIDTQLDELYTIMTFLKQSLERSIIIGGCFGHSVKLAVPIEYKIGVNWGQGKEWKYLPEQDEVMTAAEKLLNAE